MGLLDMMGADLEDPRTMATLQLASGLLGGRGNTMQRLAGGLSAYGATMGAAKKAQQEEEERKQAMQQRALQQQMLQAQLLDAQRAREEAARLSELDERFRRTIPSPQGQALQSLGADASPTLANAARMPQVDPRSQFLYDALQARQIKPMDYLAATTPKAPEYKVVGDSLVQIGGGRVSEAYRAPPKPEAAPSAVREYQFAKEQGYPGTFQQYQLEQRRAGATNVSVPINTAKPLLTTMAEGLGKQIDGNLGAAKAAVDTIDGAKRIRNLLDSGQVVTGPGADWRLAARQVGSVLGVGGQNNDEVLANTRRTMQQLAQFELDAAQSMKGQGAITESEREILRRAAAGNITFTTPELKALSTALEDRARKRIRAHNQDVDRLSQMPEGAQLVPFYRVPEPGAGSAIDDLVNKYKSKGTP